MLDLDPAYYDIDYASFMKYKWVEWYGNVKESIPPDTSEPRGNNVDLRMYMDIDHSVDDLTCRWRMGFLIYMNMDMIQWQSKNNLQL